VTELTVYRKVPTDRKFIEAIKPKSSIALIQNCFLPVATSLGFRNEAKGDGRSPSLYN
jgi:hypothetical protein